MNTKIRLKLDMGTRVLEFCIAHPDPTPRAALAVTKLQAALTRALALATQQKSGRTGARAATATKARLRRDIREDPLRHLTRIAAAAAIEEPELSSRFQLPSNSLNHQAFLAAARAMAGEAVTRRELFLSFGMPDTFLDDLTTSLDSYMATVNAATAGTIESVGARADLAAVTKEIMGLVKVLDALNRLRFRNNPELLAAWQSVRNVAWRSSGAGSPPVPPTPGDVKPAA